MEHIEAWKDVQEHQFDNMIVLCANCHARVTSGEIPKTTIKSYKKNLAIISGRYSLYELRLIETCHDRLNKTQVIKQIAENDILHVKGVIDDGLFRVHADDSRKISIGGQSVRPVFLILTETGREFVRQYFSGEEIE